MVKSTSPIAKTAFDSLQAKLSALSVGYQPLVVADEERYNNLLRRISSDLKFKRQTPLVNAGYALRVLTMSKAIHSFLTYHRYKNTKNVQLIFLGCGIDIIGIWASSIIDPTGETRTRVRIVEVDSSEICSVKQDILVEQNLVEPIKEDENPSAAGRSIEKPVFKGKIRLARGNSNDEGTLYMLISEDLREISKLDQTLSKCIDRSQPVLVVSELVLAYLSPHETDQLLAWCATRLCATSGSAMVALEPVGTSNKSTIRSVVEGYKFEYCKQFGSKVDRGISSNNTVDLTDSDHNSTSKRTSSPNFHPIAVSYESAANRFIHVGFHTAHATSLGTAAAYSIEEGIEPPELFDEHAALTLHLKSYVQTCAFAEETEELLKRCLCPWFYAKQNDPQPIPICSNKGTTNIITVIEAIDEIPTRTLFGKTYEDLFQDFPAVRKMTKTALKTDLAINPSHTGIWNNASAICTHYKSAGGCFLVAITYDETGTRQVVGCVGIKQCLRKDMPNALEIFRLAVDANHQAQGIGRTLLEVCEKLAISRPQCDTLIATTISILSRANKLYELCGFKVEKDSVIGTNLAMRTYIKPL